uniref:Uncharacterized protein ORF-c10_048 n=1 Tax=Saccharolobus solfataricus TaxID=2287 RepID=Q9UX71_SACSO|nr:hypothetical protein [Saccharolobus solfataricus P2]
MSLEYSLTTGDNSLNSSSVNSLYSYIGTPIFSSNNFFAYSLASPFNLLTIPIYSSFFNESYSSLEIKPSKNSAFISLITSYLGGCNPNFDGETLPLMYILPPTIPVPTKFPTGSPLYPLPNTIIEPPAIYSPR